MKKYLKKFIEKILYFYVKVILWRYQPQIIGITGSVGKTSTKEAIYQVLSQKFLVWCNQKNYNNEIGLPLAVLGLESGGKSIISWINIIGLATGRALLGIKNYPQILILEMGADHPGDLAYLVRLAPPAISVVTSVAPAHLEFFKTIEAVAKEKSVLVKVLSADGLAILNADNQSIAMMASQTKATVITFGVELEADFKASEAKLSFAQNQPQGLSFKVSCKGSNVPVLLSKVLAPHLVYAALAAMAVGTHYGLNLVEIIQALKNWQPPKGRMNLISGIKQTQIIDDTYNSLPQSAKAALQVLASIPLAGAARRWAVLGDILELGDYTQSGHEEVAREVVTNKIDELVTVGKLAKIISDRAVVLGLAPEKIHYFDDNASAGRFVQQEIKSGDIILVKGSQGARMEKVVKEIMAQPKQAKELLVRQDKQWLV